MNKIKKENFSKSVTYLLVSQGLIKVLGLIYSLYLINKPKFGDEGNAIYLSGYQIFIFMITFSSIGVSNAVSSIVAKCEDYNSIKKIYKSAILVYVSISCISCFLLYLLSNVIAEKFIGIEVVSYNLKILAPIIILNAFESIAIGYFNGIKQMKITAKIQFLEQLLKCIFTIGLVESFSLITDDANVLSIGATLGVALSILCCFLICIYEKRRVCIYTKKFENIELKTKDIVKNLLKFSIPISFGAMLVGINKNIDSFTIMNLLAKKINKDYAQKIYGIIASKVDVLIVFPLAFNSTFSVALIPNISEAINSRNIADVKKYVQNSIFLSIIIGITSTVGLYFFSEEIFALLFSNSQNGSDFLKLSAFSVFFTVMNQTFCGILQGLRKNKIPVYAMFCGMVSKVFLNFILISSVHFYENGIIISTIISNIIMFCFLYYEVQKNIKIHFKRFSLLIFGVSLIMVYTSIFLRKKFFDNYLNSNISFIISTSIGGMLYIFLLTKINIFFDNFSQKSKKMKKNIKKI